MAEPKGTPEKDVPSPTDDAAVGHRPDEGEFLASVLADLEEVPETLTERLSELLDSENRAADIRDLFEELTR